MNTTIYGFALKDSDNGFPVFLPGVRYTRKTYVYGTVNDADWNAIAAKYQETPLSPAGYTEFLAQIDQLIGSNNGEQFVLDIHRQLGSERMVQDLVQKYDALLVLSSTGHCALYTKQQSMYYMCTDKTNIERIFISRLVTDLIEKKRAFVYNSDHIYNAVCAGAVTFDEIADRLASTITICAREPGLLLVPELTML